MATILIGGKERPFHVGVNQGDEFCRLQGFSLAQYAATFSNVAVMGIGTQRDFIFSALKAANDRAGVSTDFTNLEVGDWMDEPEYDAAGVLTPIISALGAQFKAKADYQKQRDAKNVVAPETEPAKPETTLTIAS